MKFRNWLFVFISVILYSSVFAQKYVKIQIEGDEASSHPTQKGILVLNGNVIFRHEGSVMHCDSAYFNEKANSFQAFSNVHINIGDTLFITGNRLMYDGNARIMEMFENVKMKDPDQELTTNYLHYDRNKEIAFYSNGGKIIDAENTLTSKIGYYYAILKEFFFKGDVRLESPKYVMNADTLMYNTCTNIAYFYGKSRIVTNDSTYIFCQNGWFDTQKNISQFNKDAYLITEGRSITGDSLYYDSSTKFGKAIKNVEFIDTANTLIFRGNYGETDELKRKTFITDSALAILYDKADSVFLHADTLMAFNDSVQNISEIYAYYNVCFYSKEYQGICDSLVYIASDSATTMHNNPILWNSENQITGDTIRFIISNDELKQIYVCNSAFLISQSDSGKYDQIKGLNMLAHLSNNELYKVDVFKNSECVYYVRDDNDKKEVLAIFKTQSSDMAVYIDDRKISNVSCINDVEGDAYPEDKIQQEDLFLKNFKWLGNLRPLNKMDVFLKRPKKK